MSYTLGISAFYHDSAAVLLRDDVIVAAIQEERFTRIKHDKSFPLNAIKQCLKIANIKYEDIDLVCYYEDPHQKFKRIIYSYLKYFPKKIFALLTSLPNFLIKKNIVQQISTNLKNHFGDYPSRIVHFEHHLSHAASAFYPSPFKEAAIICIDGVGEFATLSVWHGKDADIQPLWQINFPHSLGLLYSAFTQYCGFKVDSGEYKLMGLAPYGKPIYKDLILKHLINIHHDGTFTLNMKYFDYEVGDSMVNENFMKLFGGKCRLPESAISQKEMDLASSIQDVTEQIVLSIAKKVKKDTNLQNLCLAGGVALNCVANGKLVDNKIFDEIWIQPAASDAGGALGAAYLGYYKVLNQDKKLPIKSTLEDRMQGAYLGNSYNDHEIKVILNELHATYEYHLDNELYVKTANLINQDKVIGWFQGRMEFGPRSLGARSILGNPKSTNMQSILNLKIKNRESFRPFAPAILENYTTQWFNLSQKSPYMLIVAQIDNKHKITDNYDDTKTGMERLKQIRSTIQAVTHVDFSARIQTVNGQYNKKFYKLIDKFNEISNCPIVINTSFNVRGEPIVESPLDAYKCFMRTEMDYLVVGNFILDKSKQNPWHENEDWRNKYVD